MRYATQHPHHFRQLVAGRGFDESVRSGNQRPSPPTDFQHLARHFGGASWAPADSRRLTYGAGWGVS